MTKLTAVIITAVTEKHGSQIILYQQPFLSVSRHRGTNMRCWFRKTFVTIY